MTQHLSRLIVAGWLICCLGCNNDGLVPVSGTVSWNGEPIEKGMINFFPTDASKRPHGEKIVDGKFAFRASPGEKRVEIFADRPVGKPDPVMNLQRYEQFIPTRYNEETELTASVASSGENSFDFALEQKKGDKMAGSGVSMRPN
jgi:hypothetical protein